jgi:hypothetical protein
MIVSKLGTPVELVSREDRRGWVFAKFTWTDGTTDIREIHVYDLKAPGGLTEIEEAMRHLPGHQTIMRSRGDRGMCSSFPEKSKRKPANRLLPRRPAALLFFLLLVPSLRAQELPVAPVAREHKLTLVLAAVGEAAAISDIATTEHLKTHLRSFWEEDPIARPFVLAPKGVGIASFVGYSAAVNVAAFRMSESHNRTIRRFSWAPQVLQASLNAAGAIHNQNVRDHYRQGIRTVFLPPVPAAPPVSCGCLR